MFTPGAIGERNIILAYEIPWREQERSSAKINVTYASSVAFSSLLGNLTSRCATGIAFSIDLSRRCSGIGAGTKDFDKHPNILRVILGEVPPPPPSGEPQPVEQIRASPADGARETGSWIMRQLWVLEANIDDMTGEAAGYLMEVLLEAGCLDAWLCPILMKKGRPAFTVSVLCEQHDQERFVRLLFTESSTLGVRRRSVERCALRRKTVPVSTTFGDVRVKVGERVRLPHNYVWTLLCC